MVRGRSDVGRQVTHRKFPLIGNGEGVFSFVHIDDAARATVMAVTAPPGVYNIVDDTPVRFSVWLPAFADALNARAPMRVPEWLARMVAGGATVTWMKTLKGASNARAKSALGWASTFPSYIEGFKEGLGATATATLPVPASSEDDPYCDRGGRDFRGGQADGEGDS